MQKLGKIAIRDFVVNFAKKAVATSIAAEGLITVSSLFPPNLIDQSSCRILTIPSKTKPILHDDWSLRLGEKRLDRTLAHLAAMLLLCR